MSLRHDEHERKIHYLWKAVETFISKHNQFFGITKYI